MTPNERGRSFDKGFRIATKMAGEAIDRIVTYYPTDVWPEGSPGSLTASAIRTICKMIKNDLTNLSPTMLETAFRSGSSDLPDDTADGIPSKGDKS